MVDASSAALLLAPLLVTGVIAIIAYVTRCRLAFLCGAAACWLAATPAPRIHAQYRSGEAAAMHSVSDNLARSGERAPIAGLVGTTVGLILSEIILARSLKRQKRLRRPTAIPTKLSKPTKSLGVNYSSMTSIRGVNTPRLAGRFARAVSIGSLVPSMAASLPRQIDGK